MFVYIFVRHTKLKSRSEHAKAEIHAPAKSGHSSTVFQAFIIGYSVTAIQIRLMKNKEAIIRRNITNLGLLVIIRYSSCHFPAACGRSTTDLSAWEQFDWIQLPQERLQTWTDVAVKSHICCPCHRARIDAICIVEY